MNFPLMLLAKRISACGGSCAYFTSCFSLSLLFYFHSCPVSTHLVISCFPYVSWISSLVFSFVLDLCNNLSLCVWSWLQSVPVSARSQFCLVSPQHWTALSLCLPRGKENQLYLLDNYEVCGKSKWDYGVFFLLLFFFLQNKICSKSQISFLLSFKGTLYMDSIYSHPILDA